MRFLHTADWHLGKLFHGLHLTEDQSYVLDQLIQITKDEKTDAVLIAGDIYDRSVPPVQAVELLNDTLERLIREAGQKVILIAGNHDNPERLGFASRLLAREGLYITGPLRPDTKPVLLEDEAGPVYVAPLTYGEPLAARSVLAGPGVSHPEADLGQPPPASRETGNSAPASPATPVDPATLATPVDPATAATLTTPATPATPALQTHEEVLRRQLELMLPQIPPHARKIALAHVFLTGATPSPDSERALAIGGVTTVPAQLFAPFNYTALGHLHMCQSCGEHIRYGGSLLKYSFNEAAQKKGVQIVDLAADGKVQLETIPLRPWRDLRCLKGSFAELLQHPAAEDLQAYLQITLTDPAPILDVKYRLEQVYPHILHLQYERLQPREAEAAAAPRQQLGPAELFQNFFAQTSGRELTGSEQKLLQSALAELQHQEEI